jgi:cold shock CspA family protein
VIPARLERATHSLGGYGFISYPEGSIFFHISDIQNRVVAEGDKVIFTPGINRDKPIAKNIKILSNGT